MWALSGHPGQYTETETDVEDAISHNAFHDLVVGTDPTPLQQYFIYSLEGNNNPHDYVRIPVVMDGKPMYSQTIYFGVPQSETHIVYHTY